MFYGALYAPPSPALPAGLLYTKQIRQPLDWVAAFLEGRVGSIVRMMDVDTHFGRGRSVEIVTDASPYGVGAYLCIDGEPVEYSSDRTTAADA